MTACVVLVVAVSACLPTSSGRGDGTSAPEIADQAEYEAVRDKAKQTVTRAMHLAIDASGSEFTEPDDPVSIVTVGCDLQPDNVQEVRVVSGLRYRGSDAAQVAPAVARAWREAGWGAEMADETNVGFEIDLGSGVTMGLDLSGPSDAPDGDGLLWAASATGDCMDLPDDVSEKIQTGDL